ncbi:glycosyltransferase [Candidatus Aalborgicola defluviihabitans]|uniref:glycosyltransferase n=1 Tax=Candidatus Aalborgicola defluviihabitans TaxID=3386187 RepID=UPI0039B9CBF6
MTDNFFPLEVNAPASRTFEHCREWVKAGQQVTVITCAPNFPKGRVFDGYRNRLWQSAEMDGIRVIRVWTYITANEGFAKRILDYVSFMVAATLAALFVRKVDVVVGTSPQFFTVCGACVTGFLKRVPGVFELRDIWPESIKAVGAMQDSLALRWLERLELFLYRNASRVVAVTHAFGKADSTRH